MPEFNGGEADQLLDVATSDEVWNAAIRVLSRREDKADLAMRCISTALLLLAEVSDRGEVAKFLSSVVRDIEAGRTVVTETFDA